MKGRKILGVLLLLISLCLIGSGTFLMINGNRIRFVNALKKATSNILEDVDTIKNLFVVSGYDASKTSNKFSTMNTIKFGNEKIILNGDFYSKVNSKTDGYFDLKFNGGQSSINLDILLKDSKVYVRIKEVADRYFYGDFDLINETSELKKEDIAVFKDYLLNATFKILSKNAVNKEKKDITLGGIVYKLDKLTIEISEKNLNDIGIEFLKKVSEDAKYKDIMASLFQDGKSLDSAIKEMEEESNSFSDELLVKYSIYLDAKDNILRHEIADDTGDEIIINSYKDKDDRKQFLLEINSEDGAILSLEIKAIDNSQSVITGKVMGEPLISGTYTRTDNLIDLELALNMGEDSLKLKYKFERIENNQYNMAIIIDVMSLVVVESNNLIVLGSEYPNVDINNSVKFEEMTDDEELKLYEIVVEILPILDMLGTNSEISETM